MKKICIVNMQLYVLFDSKSSMQIGGTEVQLYFLAKYLSNDKTFSINVITGDWGQKKIERYDNINIIKAFSSKKTFWNYIKAPFILWHSLVKSNSDMYIASPAGVETGIIAFFCKIYNKKFIYRTAHDIDCNGEFIKNNFIFGQSYKYGLMRANKVITQNKKNQKQLKDNHNINAIIIRNSWNINIKNNNNKKFILWVARCTSWKNPQIFLELAKANSKEKFVMISPIQKNERDLFSVVKKNADSLDNVEFIDFMPFENIQKYYNEAKLFINTSNHEGFPNSFIQACLGATPIVSFKVNPDNILLKEDIGYFADNNKNKLLKILQNNIKNENEWNRKSENCCKYIKKYHDIKKNGKIWKKKIESLL